MRRHEQGNALFLILIAVALFAALSYAVTQSGRGSGTINKEQAVLDAAKITQAGALLQAAVTRMRLTGTDFTSVIFETAAGTHCTSGANCFFSPENFGPEPDIDFTYWSQYDTIPLAMNVTDIGTGAWEILVTRVVSKEVCTALNKGLGLAVNPIVADTSRYTVDANLEAYPGKAAACLEEETGFNSYIYYQVLVEY